MSFLTIPADIFYLIIPLLPVKSICSLECICRLFARRLHKDNSIWSTLYRLHLSETIPQFNDEPRTVKGRYILHMRALMSLVYYDGDLEFSASNGHDIWLRRGFKTTIHKRHINIGMMAIRNGHVGCLRVFLDSGCEIMDPLSYLIEGVKSNRVEIVEFLFDRGFPMNAKDSTLLLRKATRKNNGPMVTLLLKKTYEQDLPMLDMSRLARTAVSHNAYASIRAFHTFDPKWGDRFLDEAIKETNREVTKFLIEDEYTLPLNIDKALELACEKGDYHTVLSLFYHRRVNVNPIGGAPLIKATKGGHPIIVQFLLEKGADSSVLAEKYRLLYRV